MSDQLRADLETLLKKCESASQWDNADRRDLKQLRAKLGTVAEVAEVLGVSKPTLRWWERQMDKANQLQPPPPVDKLEKLHNIVIEKHFKGLIQKPTNSPGASANSFFDFFVRLRDFRQIMERAMFAQNIWAFRFGRPFKVGLDQQLFDQMAKIVLDKGMHLFFVYRDTDPNDPEAVIYEAKKSFMGIKQKIANHIKAHPADSRIKDLIHGVPVKDSQADKLGLTDPWVSFTAAEYTDAGYVAFGRAIDVWTESFVEGSDEDKLVWLELPPAEATKWKQRRALILNEAAKKCGFSGGAK